MNTHTQSSIKHNDRDIGGMMNIQSILNVDGRGKAHIWSHEHPDDHGGHYLSLCGHHFGIEWTLDDFKYREQMCKKCLKIAEGKGWVG